MTSIDEIANNGFSLPERGGRLTELELFSLKTALKASFSTYQSMKYSLHLFDANNKQEQGTIDFNHSPSYCEACAEAIVHFQHFAELVCKDMLRDEHPLLAADASNHPVVLHKLLKGKQVTTAEQEKLRSIEFKDTLERLCALIKDGQIGNGQLNFIVQYQSCLEHLNKLRNRLWHRGTFILRYPALDEFIGKYVLCFLNDVVSLPKYSESRQLWKYQDLKCAIDPIDSIIGEFRGSKPDLGKVAFIKELGRAAYENPLRSDGWARTFNLEYQHRAERMAVAETKEPNGESVRDCPVCGIKSLVVYNDVEIEGENQSEGTYERAWWYTYQVKCMCCTFEINHHLKNPSVYGLPIDDYWSVQEK